MTRNLTDSQVRIRHHQKDPYEYVFHAMVYTLKCRDYESALWLKGHLRQLKGGDE